MAVIKQTVGTVIDAAGDVQIFDLDAARGSKCRVIVEVTTAGTSLDFTVEWSGNGDQWAQFSAEDWTNAFTTSTGAETEEFTLAGRYLRLTPTVSGSYTVNISVIA